MDTDFSSIEERLRESFSVSEGEDDIEQPAPATDIYNKYENTRRKETRLVRPHGSSAVVLAATRAVIDGDGVPESGLGFLYRRAKCEADKLGERGEKVRAGIIRRQYMEEHFLPAVETVIRFSSPDELLNNKEALRALDDYALGTGDKSGYTASYVRSAYGDQLGEDLNDRFGQSDPAVRDAVRKISALAAADEIRSAIGLAKRIKKAIDDGERMASDNDYEMIGRVVAYGE